MKATLKISLEDSGMKFSFEENDREIDNVVLKFNENNISNLEKVHNFIIKHIDYVEIIRTFNVDDSINNQVATIISDILEKELKNIRNSKKDFNLEKE